MLNSAEHEILNAHKYKNINKIQLFSDSDKPRMQFFPLINVKMSTTDGILTFMSGKNFILSKILTKNTYNYTWTHPNDKDEQAH